MRRIILLVALLLPIGLRAQTDTTAISTTGEHTVSREQMNKGLVTSGLGALSGQSAGVTVSGANQAAMLSAVRVRGTTSLTGGNDPLVIIDGVISDLSTLGSLYPGDIDSFTILKDASETAQYGSRGASGVIKVSTRRSRGGAFSISYDGTGGVEAVSKNLSMLGADGFRSWNDAHGYIYDDHGFSSNMPASILRTGWVQNHHLAFGGGSEDSHYRASIGVLDHQAVVQTQKYENYSIKLDIGQKAFNRLQVDLGVFASLQNNADLHDMQHLFYSSAAFNPTFRDTAEPDGTYCQIPAASQINHPASLLEKQYGSSNAHFNAHLQARMDLTRDLNLNAFASYSYNGQGNEHFFPTIVWSHGEAYRESATVQDIVGNLSLSYSKELGRHHLSGNLMAEAQSTTTSGFYTTTTGFDTNIFGLDAIQAGADRPWDGTGSYWNNIRMLSFMASANYSWKNTYVLAATLRADASSKFGKSHRWGWFPSVSASWVASNEPFLKDVSWLSKLKFNAGYGLSGNQGALGPYNSLQLIAPSGQVSYNGNSATTFGVLRNANPDLKWEVRSSVNAGFESAFLDNRIVFTAEYYYSLTHDMLYEYQVSVPPFAYSSLMANLGRMSNSGVELGLGANLIQKQDMELNVNMNLSFQRNKLISLSGYWQGEYLEAPEVQGINAMNGAGFHGGHNDVVFQIVGQPLGVFYLPHCTGLSKADDGSYYYETDGVNRICGQASPKAMLGSNVSFRYRDVDISMQVNGASATLEALDANGFGTPSQDPRFDLNYWGGVPEDLEGNDIDLEYKPRSVALDVTGTADEKLAGARMRKYEIDPNAMKDGKLMDNDWVIFRYADVLLMRAEALLHNGDTDGALTLVNAVRERAGAVPFTALTLDMLLQERMREFAWEGLRRQDMIRFGVYGKAWSFRQSLPGEESTGYTKLFPIPADIRALNPKLTQNEGYGN